MDAVGWQELVIILLILLFLAAWFFGFVL